MSSPHRISATVRRTPVLIAIVVALIIVVIWLFAYFLPQGHDLSTLQAKEATLQEQLTAGNAKVAKLRHTFQHASQFQSLEQKMAGYVPSTPNVFKTTANYTSLLSSTVASAHMSLTSVSPGGSSVSGKTFTVIPVSLIVKGTYDNLLQLVHDLYTLPRLTDIKALSITGGGPGTNRTTTLSATLSLETFTTAKVSPTS